MVSFVKIKIKQNMKEEFIQLSFAIVQIVHVLNGNKFVYFVGWKRDKSTGTSYMGASETYFLSGDVTYKVLVERYQ